MEFLLGNPFSTPVGQSLGKERRGFVKPSGPARPPEGLGASGERGPSGCGVELKSRRGRRRRPAGGSGGREAPGGARGAVCGTAGGSLWWRWISGGCGGGLEVGEG